MEWGKKSLNKQQGQGIATDIGGVAADAFLHYGVPWLAKKTVKMGRYGASELMRNRKLQKKAINYGINKLTPFIQDSVWYSFRRIIHQSQTQYKIRNR